MSFDSLLSVVAHFRRPVYEKISERFRDYFQPVAQPDKS
jgi:hypothetical protein